MESHENQQIQASIFLFLSPPAPLPDRRWHKRHAQVRAPYVSLYSYKSPYSRVLTLLNMCPHTTTYPASIYCYTCILILLHICIYVGNLRQHTILLSDNKKKNAKPPDTWKKKQKKRLKKNQLCFCLTPAQRAQILLRPHTRAVPPV
jgi:hypothetical protein